MLAKHPVRMLVTDRRRSTKPLDSFLPQAVKEFAVSAVLLREKDLDRASLAALAHSLLRVLPCPLILRAPPSWAVDVGASGVHCDASDAPVIRDGSERPFALLGTSVHSRDEALVAQALGFDYAFFGPVLDTTKGGQRVRGVGLRALEEVCRAVELPIIAIGGMNEGSETAVLDSGARGWAAIRCFLPEGLG